MGFYPCLLFMCIPPAGILKLWRSSKVEKWDAVARQSLFYLLTRCQLWDLHLYHLDWKCLDDAKLRGAAQSLPMQSQDPGFIANGSAISVEHLSERFTKARK